MNLNIPEPYRSALVPAGLIFTAGFGAGYFVCHRRNKETTWTVERTTTEVVEENDLSLDEPVSEEARNQLALDFARTAAEQADHPVRIRDLRPVPEPDPEPEMAPDPDEDWDQAEEEANRGPNAPYVIHREEYFSNSTGYAQADLEYFAGDDVLCGEDRVPLYNATKLVGRLEFGRGSGDSDVVYIRNEEHRAEYQVTRVEHSYAQEVLGQQVEEEAEENDLRHSNTVLKFRDD